MSVGFTRRYTTDPGLEELLKIEGVVLIEREPPSAPVGGATGFTCLVGEFEDGPFNVPTEIVSSSDFLTLFGGFGFTYDGVGSNNPCARARKADGAIQPEYWNGNGFVAAVSKKFRGLALVRVDTSVGAVEFTRRASILGNSLFQWDLEPGEVLSLDIGGGPISATFSAAAAQKSSSAGTFPAVLSGGETMTIVVDEGTANQIGPKPVTFLSTDTTQAALIARINLTFGFTLAVDAGAGVTRLNGRVRGSSGKVQVTAQNAAIGTALNFNLTAANGTGNVANIDSVTLEEIKAVVEAAVAGTKVERTPSGQLRVMATAAASITVGVLTTAAALGFTVGQTNAAASGSSGFIAAGTRVRNAGGTEWVTCQTVEVLPDSAGPYSVKVRPALDDGSVAGAGAGLVNVLPFGVELAAFTVINPQPLSAALTEAAIDAAYVTALSKTLSPNSVAKRAETVFCARQSNAIRQALRQNAVEASAAGLTGRKAPICPPLGTTTRAQARSASLQPGVGAYRSDRVYYCFPGARIFLPQIAARGTAGGAGFTANGNIDVHFDSFVASCCSQLNPEENPGQLTDTMTAIVGLEAGNPDVQDMTVDDYTAFRAAGIAALRMDDGVAIIQSGVVAVNPVLYPALRNISRRRMTDHLLDSFAIILSPFNKKLTSRERRGQALGTVEAYLDGLLSKDNPASQRIDGYRLDGKSGNTPNTLALGIYRILARVRLLSSMDVIVVEATVGEGVVITELAA